MQGLIPQWLRDYFNSVTLTIPPTSYKAMSFSMWYRQTSWICMTSGWTHVLLLAWRPQEPIRFQELENHFVYHQTLLSAVHMSNMDWTHQRKGIVHCLRGESYEKEEIYICLKNTNKKRIATFSLHENPTQEWITNRNKFLYCGQYVSCNWAQYQVLFDLPQYWLLDGISISQSLWDHWYGIPWERSSGQATFWSWMNCVHLQKLWITYGISVDICFEGVNWSWGIIGIYFLTGDVSTSILKIVK